MENDTWHGKGRHWPAGLGGKGNEGVSGLLTQMPDSIGYLELGYAMQNKIPVADLKNKSGHYVKASLQSVSAAAAGATIQEDYRSSIVNADGADAYPISAMTYILVYEKPAPGPKSKAVVDFLKWALHDGQALAGPLWYSKLPDSLVKRIDATLAKLPAQ